MKFPINKLTKIILATSASFIAMSPIAFGEEKEEQVSRTKDIEVIQVSSTRMGTTVAKTSAAVTALSAKDLLSAGITDPTSLQDQTPNISIDRNDGLQITIRGVSSSDNTEKGDPSASFLQDGVYIARAQAQEVSFFDLDQVEVLRGPQGTLYGRNATAGLINVMSAKPTIDDQYGSLDMTVGDYNQKQATAMINLPISDSAAIRAAVNIDKRDSYLIDGVDSSFSQGLAKDNTSLRLSGFFEPDDDINLLVRADYSQIKGNERSTVMLSNFFDLATISAPSGNEASTNPTYIGGNKSSDQLRTIGWADVQPATTDNNTWGIMSELNLSLSDDLTMTYLGSYRQFNRDETSSRFFGVHPLAGGITTPNSFDGEYNQQSHELRLNYNTDQLNIQGGLYHFDEDSDIVNILDGVLAGALPGDLGTAGNDGYIFGFPQTTNARSFAIFAQGQYSITDDFALTVGVRQTNDDKSRRGATIMHITDNEALNFIQSATNPLPDSLNNAKVSYEKTTWKVGIEYDVSEDILAYGHISTGYKAGGFNDGCIASDADCFEPKSEDQLYFNPEDVTAYEFGLKMDLENGLRTFVSMFHYDYKDLQLNSTSDACGGPCQIISNAGQAEIDGVELESRYEITDLSKLTAALTWLDAKYTDYAISQNVNLAGKALNRSPELTLMLGYQHIWLLDDNAAVTLNAQYRWSDEYAILSDKLVTQFIQPSYSKSDLSITYTSPEEDWYVQAYVKNIEDEMTINMASISIPYPNLLDGSVTLGAPRTLGVRFGLEF